VTTSQPPPTPTDTTPPPTSTPPSSPSGPTTHPQPPTIPKTNAQAAVWLRQWISRDRPKVERSLNRWMAIVSSKNRRMPPDDDDQVFPGRKYTNLLIMKNFQYWKDRYPKAMLAYSSAYTSHHPGWYLVLVPVFRSDPDDVNGWCQEEGIDPNNCHATRVSHTIPQGPRTSRTWS